MTPEDRKAARAAGVAAKKTGGANTVGSADPQPQETSNPPATPETSTPAELKVDVQSELGPKRTSSKGGQAHVFENTTDGKQLIRTYSAELHGKGYADLADQFVEKFKGKKKDYFIEGE